MNKNQAVQRYGAEVIELAVGYHETDYGKDFFRLPDEEQGFYIANAQRNLNTPQVLVQPS